MVMALALKEDMVGGRRVKVKPTLGVRLPGIPVPALPLAEGMNSVCLLN